MGRCGGNCGGGDADQAVEDEAKVKSGISGIGRSEITVDIGVAYALVGISSSVSIVVVVDMAGVASSNDCIENGRLGGSGIGELGTGDFGKSVSYQVPGIKATGTIQVAVNVIPQPFYQKKKIKKRRFSKDKELNSPTSKPPIQLAKPKEMHDAI